MKRSVVVARASSVEKNRSLWRRVTSQERTRELTLGLIFTRISPRAVRPSQLSSSRYLRAPKIHRLREKIEPRTHFYITLWMVFTSTYLSVPSGVPNRPTTGIKTSRR